MKTLIIIIILFFPPLLTVVVLYYVIKMADHYEMLSLAVADYLTDDYNFDISHYPDVTEREIQNHIKWLSQRKKEELQRKCNNKTGFIFDEDEENQ